MKINQQTEFKPIILTLETSEEVHQLWADLTELEDFRVNVHTKPRKKNLSRVSINILDAFTDKLNTG